MGYVNIGHAGINKVLAFSEKTKGWVSFRSFHQMQLAISMGNDYYTFKNGNLWKHYDETVDRNTFYDFFTESSISVLLNDNPDLIKAFNTLNYEGSQSNIPRYVSEELELDYQPTTIYNDQEIYNLSDKYGWYVEKIFTDKEEGYINEFIEKEGKWFNNINRLISKNLIKADTADFTFQGIGGVTNVNFVSGAGSGFDPSFTDPDDGDGEIGVSGGFSVGSGDSGGLSGTSTSTQAPLQITGEESLISREVTVYGCTDPNATNYDPNATVDDGSCIIREEEEEILK